MYWLNWDTLPAAWIDLGSDGTEPVGSRPAAGHSVTAVTCRPVCPDCVVADDVTVNDNNVSVAGGDSVFSADDISVSGSAHSGRPVHQSPRTSARALPAGADPGWRDLRI